MLDGFVIQSKITYEFILSSVSQNVPRRALRFSNILPPEEV